MTHPQHPTVSLRSKLAAALTDCPHTLEHDRVELRYAPGQQGGNTLAQILTRLEAAFAATPPASAEPQALTWDDALRIARGCTDYGGGHRGDAARYEAYQDGIQTVITALTHADAKDPQTRALMAMAAAPSAAPSPASEQDAKDGTPLIARALAEWHEDDGPVMWWAWCGHEWAGEPAWCGTPADSDWPGYHTHWTPHPGFPAAMTAAQGGSKGE